MLLYHTSLGEMNTEGFGVSPAHTTTEAVSVMSLVKSLPQGNDCNNNGSVTLV